jgi:hypothetical protein
MKKFPETKECDQKNRNKYFILLALVPQVYDDIFEIKYFKE